ncbi:MAG: Trigger factor [Parcubacteria group bacterium GW2011_GWF2_43_11]|nr:MAG: Trigger factor [Parcubacteria group bacterium GW2011_GWF2_43_11]
MNHSIQKLAKSQLEIKCEVPAEEFQTFVEKAILKLGENVAVEGFRKGKAPKETIEKILGQEAILKEASQECVRDNYLKVVKDESLEPLGQPEISVLPARNASPPARQPDGSHGGGHSDAGGKLAINNPFEFKAVVTVLPEITIADYQEIVPKIKKREVKVTLEEIEKLKQEKERIEREKLRQEILDKIAAGSKMEIPEVLIDSEKNRMLATIKEQVPQMLGIGFEEYLKKINKTEKEISDSFLPEAERRIKNSLVLREIQKREKIEIPEKELSDEMAKIAKQNPNLDKNQLKDYTESVIKNEKAFEYLEGLTK